MNNSTAVIEPAEGHTEWENNLAGVICILTSLPFVMIYIPCLYIFATDKELSVKACYRFMFHLGITDVVQLILLGFAGGIFCIFGTFHTWVPRVCGMFGNGVWFVNNCFAHLLAFDRFLLVCLPMYEHKVFKAGGRILMFIVISWCWSLPFVTSYLVPTCHLTFFISDWVWFFGEGYVIVPYCIFISWVDFCQNWVQLGMMGFWYTCVIIRLKLMPQMGSTDKKELRVLLQCFLIFASLVLLNLYWWVIMPRIDNQWALLGILITWNAYGGLNTVIYLVFNTQLRRKYAALLGFKGAAVQPTRTAVTKVKPTSDRRAFENK